VLSSATKTKTETFIVVEQQQNDGGDDGALVLDSVNNKRQQQVVVREVGCSGSRNALRSCCTQTHKMHRQQQQQHHTQKATREETNELHKATRDVVKNNPTPNSTEALLLLSYCVTSTCCNTHTHKSREEAREIAYQSCHSSMPVSRAKQAHAMRVTVLAKRRLVYYADVALSYWSYKIPFLGHC
jgi:hypothetical protein